MPEEKQQRERINCLLRLMKENRYPNFSMVLSEMRKADAAIHFVNKTIQRDVEYLKASFKAPIEYDPSKRGYYLLNPNWNGFAPLLDEEEMEAAAIGAHLAETILPPSKIQSRIRQGTDALWAQNATSPDQSFAVLEALVARGCSAKVNPDVFQIVFEQWRSQHDVIITYLRVNSNRPQIFTIEPHVLTLHDNVWYVRGRAVTGKRNPVHGDFRTFALHRIQEAVRDGRLFEPDYAEITRVNNGQLFDFPRLKDVKLKISGHAKKYGLELLPLENVEERGDGSAIVTLEDIEEYRVINFVMTSNGEANILEPASLNEKARATAKRVIQGLEKA
ncbi:MAG: WYL domain-containing protein [Victivallales bacterium]|nr:WYL domain-containing protein [Victivallales bacterium]